MSLQDGHHAKSKYSINLNNFLIGSFACWPLFYALWSYLRVTANISIALSIVFLWAIAFLASIFHRLTKSYTFFWFVFVLMVALGFTRAATGTFWDILTYISGVLFCWAMGNSDWDYELLLKWAYRAGLLIAISVIVDSITGLFAVTLINIFSEPVIFYKLRSATRTGLMSSSGIASYFILVGLLSYYEMTKLNIQINNRFKPLIFLIFAVSFIMLQKRGLLLGSVLSMLFIQCLTFFYNSSVKINMISVFKKVLIFFVVVGFSVFLYNEFPAFTTAVDLFYDKIIRDEDIFSGRLVLYNFAITLFLSNPVTGIGWGQYREQTMHIFSLYSQTTFDAHNVFLQLLCETGIIGVSFFVVAVAVALNVAIKTYSRCLKEKNLTQYSPLSQAGLFMQVFFLFYCMSGNPLYDRAIVIMYFFGILLTNLARYKLVKEKQKYA